MPWITLVDTRVAQKLYDYIVTLELYIGQYGAETISVCLFRTKTYTLLHAAFAARAVLHHMILLLGDTNSNTS